MHYIKNKQFLSQADERRSHNLNKAFGLRGCQLYVHKNLLNAGFASVWIFTLEK